MDYLLKNDTNLTLKFGNSDLMLAPEGNKVHTMQIRMT